MDELIIGVIGRPHGVHGAVRVTSSSDEVDHFRALSRVTLERDGRRRDAVVTGVAVHGRTPILSLEGVSSPEEARQYTGWSIRVPRSQAAPLGQDEYYLADLIGCSVDSDEGHHGRIVAVIDAPQAPLLEVALSGDQRARTVFVPFMHVYVRTVDIAAGRVELETPWILSTE